MKMKTALFLAMLSAAFIAGCVETPRWGDNPQYTIDDLKAAVKNRDWQKAVTYYEEKYAASNKEAMNSGRHFLRPSPDSPNAKTYPVAEDDEGYSTEFLSPNEAKVKFFRLIDEEYGTTRRPVEIWFERIDGEWKIKAEVGF